MLKFAAIKDSLPLSPPAAWPLVCSFSGAALLLFAWPLALRTNYSDLLFASSVLLWGLLPLMFAGFYVRPLVSAATATRFLAVFTLFAAVMMGYPSDSYRDITAQSFSLAGIFLLALGLTAWEAGYARFTQVSRCVRLHQRISPTTFKTGAFALFLATTIFFSWYCFSFEPSYTDSSAQYIHGKFIASGHYFYYPGHPLHEFFPVPVMVHEAEKWYSQYPPLHQTFLGLGHLIHAPWLVNPLEGALTLLLVYAIARRDYGEGTARLACLLMWFSPFIVFMSSEFMNHASALLFTTLLIYAYGEFQAALTTNRRKSLLWALVAGLSAGCVFLTRPLTAVSVSLPFAAHAFWQQRKTPRGHELPLLAMATGGLACVAFQLWFNLNTTGNLFTYAYTHYHSDSFAIAMGYRNAGGFIESLLATIAKMRSEWFSLDIALFEWSLPCVFFVMLPCVAPGKKLTTRLLLGIIASQTVIGMLNHFSSTVFGPRYMYESSVPLVILTAVGMAQLPPLLQSLHPRLTSAEASHGMVALVVMLVCATGLVYRLPVKIKEYTHFMDCHPDFYLSMLRQTEHPALIFMGRPVPGAAPLSDDAAMATFRWTSWTNPPDDSAPVIFARDRGDKANRALMNYYPNRHAYIESKEKLTPVTNTIFSSP